MRHVGQLGQRLARHPLAADTSSPPPPPPPPRDEHGDNSEIVTNAEHQKHQDEEEEQHQQLADGSSSSPSASAAFGRAGSALSQRLEAAQLRKAVHDMTLENERLRRQCDSMGATIMRHHHAPPSRLTQAARRAHSPPLAGAGGSGLCWQSLQMHSSLGCKQCLATLQQVAGGAAQPPVAWDSVLGGLNAGAESMPPQTEGQAAGEAAGWSAW
jgi:hypothetical protein